MGKPFYSGLGPEFDRPGTTQPYLLERMKIYDVDREYISDQFVGEEPQQREKPAGTGYKVYFEVLQRSAHRDNQRWSRMRSEKHYGDF